VSLSYFDVLGLSDSVKLEDWNRVRETEWSDPSRRHDTPLVRRECDPSFLLNNDSLPPPLSRVVVVEVD